MRKYNPEIRIVYPEASAAALLLTEAMIRRSSGKRTVETESEEKEYNGEALFGNALACRTSTGVELTLKLNPESMDYALTTLIARNLTEEEKRAVRAATDSMEIDMLLSPNVGGAAGADTCTDDVGTLRDPTGRCHAETETEEEMRKNIQAIATNTVRDHFEDRTEEDKIEIGKVSEKKLRDILNDMIERMEKGHGTFDAVNHAIYEITKNSESPVKLAEPWVAQKIAAVLQASGCSRKSKTLDPFARGLIADLEKTNKEDEYYVSISVLVELIKTMAQTKSNDPFALYSVFGGEIEPGLLNDIDTETEGGEE